MPTYSYRCAECGTAFDIHQAFSDDSLTVCPTCGGMLRKVFSPIGVSFTGSGFYRNDSRAKPPSEKSTEKTSPEKTSTEKTGTEKTSTEKTGTGKKPEKSAPTKERAASTSSSASGVGKAATTSTA